VCQERLGGVKDLRAIKPQVVWETPRIDMPAGMLQITRVTLAGGVCLNVYHDYTNTLMMSEDKLQKKAMKKIT
jgi:hypothetical protein